jgi:hypothetical protein
LLQRSHNLQDVKESTNLKVVEMKTNGIKIKRKQKQKARKEKQMMPPSSSSKASKESIWGCFVLPDSSHLAALN